MRPGVVRLLAVTAGLVLHAVLLHAVAASADQEQEALDRILGEYRQLPTTGAVRRLVELDRELGALVQSIRKARGRESARLWRKDYEEIGLYIGHYSEELGYSGKLLVEAHRRNPTSAERRYTLYATIVGEGTPDGLGVMPDVGQARRYLSEFPHGPYAENVHEILGFFHDDLAKVLQGLLAGERDYKYDCFAPYITREPYVRQMERARAAAIRHLETAIRMRPASEANIYRREVVKSIKAGNTDAWHWCAD